MTWAFKALVTTAQTKEAKYGLVQQNEDLHCHWFCPMIVVNQSHSPVLIILKHPKSRSWTGPRKPLSEVDRISWI